MTVIGLVLLVAAIKPGPPTALIVDPGAADDPRRTSPQVVMTAQQCVAKPNSARAGQIDGIDSVSSVAGARRRVTVTVEWH